jgi:hypothetical protein
LADHGGSIARSWSRGGGSMASTTMHAPSKTSRQRLPVTAVHQNLSQEVLAITLDKLRLTLNEHAKTLGRTSDWVAPAGILVTIVLAFATATFRKWGGLEAGTWHTVFAMAGLGTAVWLVATLFSPVKAVTVDQLIEKLKNN